MDIINVPQILWQAFNFVLLYFVIAKFVVPPTKKFLAKREHQIKSGIENAEKVKKQLDEAEKMKEEILVKARAEGAAIINEMRTKADALSVKLEEEAKAVAEKKVTELMSRAEHDLEVRRQKMDEEVVQLAGVIVKKALPQIVSNEAQHSVLKHKLEDMKSSKVSLR